MLLRPATMQGPATFVDAGHAGTAASLLAHCLPTCSCPWASNWNSRQRRRGARRGTCTGSRAGRRIKWVQRLGMSCSESAPGQLYERGSPTDCSLPAVHAEHRASTSGKRQNRTAHLPQLVRKLFSVCQRVGLAAGLQEGAQQLELILAGGALQAHHGGSRWNGLGLGYCKAVSFESSPAPGAGCTPSSGNIANHEAADAEQLPVGTLPCSHLQHRPHIVG